MIEVKTLNGKLNLDDSNFRLPKNDYVDAVNITKDAVEGANDLVVSNIVSNRVVNYNYPVPSTGTIAFSAGQNPFTSGINNIGTITGTPGDTLLVNVNVPTESDFAQGNIGSDVFITGNTSTTSTVVVPISGVVNFNIFYSGTTGAAISIITNSSTNVCIGACANTLRNTIVYFIWNSNDNHLILEYDNSTRSITPIFSNLTDSGGVDVLGFTEHEKITSINIYNREEGDLLEFIDSIGRPTYMDITLMKTKFYVPVTRDMIDLATLQPLSPPQCVYANDTTKRVNYTRNKFFRFKQVGIDYTNRKTSCSPISEVPIPIGLLSDAINSIPTNNNVINVSLDSMGQDYKSIMLLMSYVDKTNTWSDFLIVDTIDKTKNSIADNTTFNYSFYNDSTYPAFDIRHSILLYDFIPKRVNCSELVNGDVTVLAGITEGYDNDITPNVVNVVSTYPVTSPSSGSLNSVVEIGLTPATNAVNRITFSGISTAGTIINIKLKRLIDNVIVTVGTYTTVSGDVIGNTTTGIIGALITNILAGGLVNNAQNPSTNTISITYNAEGASTPPRYYSDYTLSEIIAPTSSASINSISTWKWSSQRNVGIAYFDKKGVTNGILYNAQLTFPAYLEDIAGNVYLPTVNTKIYHRPPEWAWSFQFLFTKDPTQYIYWATNSVNISENDYVYFDVTDFLTNAHRYPTTATVLSYSFQDGDRMRLIKPLGTNTYFGDNLDAAILGLISDPSINGTVQTGKQFLKIKKVAPFTDATFTPNYLNYEIEIYRPLQQSANKDNKVFYECGRQYDIINPETAVRVHSGEVTDQSANLATPAEFNFTKGDSYYRQRLIAFIDNSNNLNTIIFNAMDRNIIDEYISAVSSIDGRPNAVDVNARRAYYGATIRHSEAYQANTNINGLNRFYPDNFIDVDYSYGSIERLKTRDRLLRVFQQYKIGSIPIYNQINKSPTGVMSVQTDRLLNPVQYYSGNVGIGTARESLSSNNFADYGVDNINGTVWRVSNDGVDIISLLYNINSWATEKLPLRKDTYKVYGGFDRKLNNYICSLESTATDSPYTITFDEDAKGFESFITLYPEMLCTLGTLFVAFKDGQLYTHDEVGYNNFFGVQYDSSITPVFNQNELQKKTFTAVSEIASDIWDCPEIITSSNEFGKTKQISELIESDFEELESDFHASFLRASNSEGGLIEGSTLKGNLCIIKFRKKMLPPPDNNLITLSLISVASIDSPLTVTK